MNQSFIDVQNQLKEMGVSNIDFLTKTIDKRVADLDPYNPELTKRQKQLIVEECRNNFWYFLREVAKIRIQGSEYARFKLNIASCAFLYLYENNISTWFQNSRQTGATMTAILCERYTNMFYPEKSVRTYNHIKDMYSSIMIPFYLDDLIEQPHTEEGTINIYDDAELYVSYNIFVDDLSNIRPGDIVSLRCHYISAVTLKGDDKLVKLIDKIPTFDISMFDMDIELIKLQYPIIKIDFPIEQVIPDKEKLISYLHYYRYNISTEVYMREVLKIRV